MWNWTKTWERASLLKTVGQIFTVNYLPRGICETLSSVDGTWFQRHRNTRPTVYYQVIREMLHARHFLRDLPQVTLTRHCPFSHVVYCNSATKILWTIHLNSSHSCFLICLISCFLAWLIACFEILAVVAQKDSYDLRHIVPCCKVQCQCKIVICDSAYQKVPVVGRVWCKYCVFIYKCTFEFLLFRPTLILCPDSHIMPSMNLPYIHIWWKESQGVTQI